MKICERCQQSFIKNPRETYRRYEERRICRSCATTPLSLEERFWSKVNKDGSIPSHCPELGNCWIWEKASHVWGYGEISVQSSRPEGAHRVIWVLVHGPIPEGMHVLHRCDNPPCVRPDHLFLGTHKENMRDMTSKGRHGVFDRTGERNGNAKLTEFQVTEMRERAAAGERAAALAIAYNISDSVVSGIINGKLWVNAGGPIRESSQRIRKKS